MPDDVPLQDAASDEGDRAFWLTDIGLTDPTPVKTLPPSRKEKLEGDGCRAVDQAQAVLRAGHLVLMGLQLIVVNAVSVIYADDGYHWHPTEGVVQIWLTATFVQIVSVVVVITRSLFPRRKAGTLKLRLDAPSPSPSR